jgi:hypothetical protein
MTPVAICQIGNFLPYYSNSYSYCWTKIGNVNFWDFSPMKIFLFNYLFSQNIFIFFIIFGIKNSGPCLSRFFFWYFLVLFYIFSLSFSKCYFERRSSAIKRQIDLSSYIAPIRSFVLFCFCINYYIIY